MAFASPTISTASGIVNIGFENDPIYKFMDSYGANPTSLDHLVYADADRRGDHLEQTRRRLQR